MFIWAHLLQLCNFSIIVLKVHPLIIKPFPVSSWEIWLKKKAYVFMGIVWTIGTVWTPGLLWTLSNKKKGDTYNYSSTVAPPPTHTHIFTLIQMLPSKFRRNRCWEGGERSQNEHSLHTSSLGREWRVEHGVRRKSSENSYKVKCQVPETEELQRRNKKAD